MANLNLVQEIVDLIIDHLVDVIPHRPSSYPASIHLQELKEIALISKAFTPRSQKHLFSTIEIQQKYDYKAAREAVVDAVDHLWEPEIDDANKKSPPQFTQSPRAEASSCSASPHYQNVRPLRQSGEALRVDSDLVENPEALWKSTSHQLKPDILFMQNFQIQSLTFSVWDEIPVTFITNNKDLQSLTLSCCLWTPDDVDPASIIARPAIKRLSAMACSGLLEYLVQPTVGDQSLLDFSSLEYLHVVSDEKQDMPIVRRLLPLAGRSLKEFVQTTEMFVSSGYGDLETLDELVATLETIPNSPIEKLEMNIYLDIDGENDSQPYANLPWEALDREVQRVLSAGNVTPAVGSLYIEFWRKDRHTQQDLDEEDNFTKGVWSSLKTSDGDSN
ncbi:hypothetical protein BJ165DRAFT_1592393 [Panaeolus papilionaceus]|nr:hypothetical protein BJ165DRAFT_1592393 [Panaeolus papilionaceus]